MILPLTLAPPAPFPLITAQSRFVEFVAPGIERGTYRLQTIDGPLVISVVAIDPHEPSVRFGTVLANDRMISSGETVSSMAARTGAVAGVNADYFDIGNTNQPLNVVVRGGALLRTPSKRIALDVRSDRSVHFDTFTFSATVAYGNVTMPLTTVNEWPPQGGAGFLTPSYGTLRAAPEVALADLVPVAVEHDPAEIAGAYRVASIAAATAPRTVAGPLLAFGPAAKALGAMPSVGDDVRISGVTLDPPLAGEGAGIVAAVGGGPLLVANGAPANDPNAPAPEESAVRFPVSGAGRTQSGDVILVAVDGRAEHLSIGLTRPEFAALFLGFSSVEAMAFDSGGSATLVARVLGTERAGVLNAPSDGEERAVADGFFVYSDAPVGPPARLVIRPPAIVALPGASIPVHVAVVDDAGHALGAVPAGVAGALAAGDHSEVRTLHARGVSGKIVIDVVRSVAHLQLASDVEDPAPGTVVHLRATGIDARDRTVVIGRAVRWSTDRGTISADGTYRVPAHDAHVVAVAGGVTTAFTLAVGSHDVALPFSLDLAYAFSERRRAASVPCDVRLPGAPHAFALDVRGDASGAGVRATFSNRYGERRVLRLAQAVDWSGWQPVRIPIPDDLTPPVRLVALSAVATADPAATPAAGTLGFRNVVVSVAGTP